MAHDLFISYSSEDKAIADAVCSALEAANIRCWIAPRDIIPGQDWPEAIVKGVAGSRAMVLIFSSNSKESNHVKKELALAIDSKAIVIPLKIDDIPFEGPMQYFLSDTHWLDAMNPPTEKEIQKLVETAKALLPERDVERTPDDESAAATPMEANRPLEFAPARKEEGVAQDATGGIAVLGKRLPLWALAAIAVALLALIGVGIGTLVVPKINATQVALVAPPPAAAAAATSTMEAIPTSTAPPPTAESSPTVEVAPTDVPESGDMVSGETPDDWRLLQADEISLWVPSNYIGGSPSRELDKILDELRQVDSSLLSSASEIEADPEKNELWFVDSEVGGSGVVTKCTAARYEIPPSTSSDQFLTDIIGYMPESTELITQEALTDFTYETARANLDFPDINIRQAMYVVKEGSIAWMILFTTHASEFDDRLGIFDQIVSTFNY
jgi:hypothetical protein